MSQIATFVSAKFNQYIKKVKNRTYQSTSSQPGLAAGDICQASKGTVTNVTAGTFMGLIALFALAAIPTADTHATASTLTVTRSSGSTYTNIPPTAEGKFAATGTITFGVTTTHAAGYTATASATALSFTEDNTTYAIDPLAAGTAINADTFTNNSNYNNKWGYLPSIYNSAANTNYLSPLPFGTAQTLDDTNSSASGSYAITVGARVDHTVQQGQYETNITFAAVANPTPYTITYDKNTTDIVTNLPDNVDTTTAGTTATLATGIPIRNGYAFKGWCTEAVATDGSCSGTAYMGGETVTIDQTSDTNSWTIYAMWGNCTSTKNLYNLVACQAKTNGGSVQTQTIPDMQAVITEPTSSSPSTDTSNSGVFLYSPSIHGATSDASNTNEIYYFRGILDSNLGSATYGSDGDGGYYQNYVKLSTGNTCWRIVRTTGSGGIKMIYNGTYGATTSGSCANPTTNAQIKETYFNRATPSDSTDGYGNNNFVVYAGYTYNNAYGYPHTDLTSPVDYSLIFANNTSSNAKTEIEDWYANTSSLSSYEGGTVANTLETSAGWCDDRTGYKTKPIPYDESPDHYGAWVRMDGKKLTLGCPNKPEENILTTTNGLTYPIALFTLDEIELAGDGYGAKSSTEISTYPSNWSPNSYLRSGSYSWLLSPGIKISGNSPGITRLTPYGHLDSSVAYSLSGLRPAISFTSGTVVTSGSGTATDPWIIDVPSNS